MAVSQFKGPAFRAVSRPNFAVFDADRERFGLSVRKVLKEFTRSLRRNLGGKQPVIEAVGVEDFTSNPTRRVLGLIRSRNWDLRQ